MFRLGLNALLLVALALGACKGKTTYKDDPETAQKLGECETNLKAKEAYIATLEKRIAGGDGSTVLVNIEGEAMKITGKGPHESTEGQVGTAEDAKLYEAFVSALRRSRGSIQKCYQNALKNNATLQARSVTLNIEVQYKTSGTVTDSRFSPRIDQSFDRCMDAVARRWTLPAMPRAVAFNYKQTLTPE